MSNALLILSSLVHDEEYGRKVMPFLKRDYFVDNVHATVFQLIDDFVVKYNAFPNKKALFIHLSELDNLNSETYKQCNELIDSLEPIDEHQQWLIDKTEQFCQDRALSNAIRKSIQILDGTGQEQRNAIPTILQEALAVTFDANVGHDFLEDWEYRYDLYHSVEERIAFDLDMFNRITQGGFAKKTLNIISAGTNVGKTLAMVHMAAANLSQGKNVLYITLEMAQERIAERIDANLMNVELDMLKSLPKEAFESKIERIRSKTKGRLFVKEYPTGTANAGHFRHLLNELRLKESFVPDIVYVDYINICSSFRHRTLSVGSYNYVKAIAEELRGLAVERDIPIVSATQLNRGGFSNSDAGLDDTAESFGLPMTADFMCAIISTEELEELGQYMVKQLKNRYADKNKNRRFVIGVDKARMKLYDVEQSAQEDLMDANIDMGETDALGGIDFKNFR